MEPSELNQIIFDYLKDNLKITIEKESFAVIEVRLGLLNPETNKFEMIDNDRCFLA